MVRSARHSRWGCVALLALAVAALPGCRCRDNCGPDAVQGFEGQIQVGTVVVDTHPASGQTEFSWQPATQVEAIWYAGDQSLVVSAQDGTVAIPRSEIYDRVRIQAQGYSPYYLAGWPRAVSYVVLQEQAVARGEVFGVDQTARLQGRVAHFTPSLPDEDSRVRAYWYNLQGHYVDTTATTRSRTLAEAGTFTVLDNNIDLYLPPGDNLVFLLERIVRTDDPSSYTIGGAAYYDDVALAAGVEITDQTFSLDIGQYSGPCGKDPYGYMTVRWPELDRSFIRRISGAVSVDVRLHLSAMFSVPFLQGTYGNERIRDGNALRFGFPVDLTGSLSEAYYTYQSTATRVTEWGRDVVQHARERVDGLPCDMPAMTPAAPSGLLAPTAGTSYSQSDARWPISWDTRGEGANLGSRLYLWRGAITQAADYLRYDPGAGAGGNSQPLLVLDMGIANAAALDLKAHPEIVDVLVPGIYTVEVESAVPGDPYALWQVDPLAYAAAAGESYEQWRQRSGRWISFFELTIK